MAKDIYGKRKRGTTYRSPYRSGRASNSLPHAMDSDEVSRLLSVIENTRDRAMVLLLLRTGMRIGELLWTRVGDLNLRERKVVIREGKKNGLGRVVHFSTDAYHALKAWLKKRDSQRQFLFYGRGHNVYSYTSARMMLQKYLERAGLSHKGYTLHSLRHTFACGLLNAGMSLESLQVLLGHMSLEATCRYARLADKTREADYFRAMSIIERGEIDGWYRPDP